MGIIQRPTREISKFYGGRSLFSGVLLLYATGALGGGRRR